MHLHAGWENVGIVAALPANHDILFPKALRSPTRNPIARGTTESFHDVDGTPRRQCRPTERLRQIGRFSQTSAHLGVDLAVHDEAAPPLVPAVLCMRLYLSANVM